MKDETIFKKIIKARADLVMEQPFFASLALRLRVKEDTSCRTAWTDGKVFAYNPSYVKILTPEKMKGLCCHTVMHPACAHHKRRNGRNAATWNKACDYAINPILLDAGMTLPGGFLYDESYADKTADDIYELLSQSDAENSENSDSAEKENSGVNRDEQSPDTLDQEKVTPNKPGEKEDNSSTGISDPGMSGEVRDAGTEEVMEGDTESEIDWDQAILQAAAHARRMGKLPLGIKRLIDSKINPRLCWQQLLARFIEKNTKTDYTWSVPNRRFIHLGLYFPSLNNHALNEIAVAIDTSGSIKNKELAQFGAELSAIMETFPLRLHLIYCDMRVTGYESLEKWDLPIRFKPLGGGGTDFRPVFDFLNQERIFPACLIYLTDLECRHFPSKPPEYPVLWIQTGTRNKEGPRFGHRIHLDVSSTLTATD